MLSGILLKPYNKQWMPDRTEISDNHGWMGVSVQGHDR